MNHIGKIAGAGPPTTWEEMKDRFRAASDGAELEAYYVSRGGEWADNTGGGIPVGFLRLSDGTVATVSTDSLFRWPGDRFWNLAEYLDDGDPGPPLEMVSL